MLNPLSLPPSPPPYPPRSLRRRDVIRTRTNTRPSHQEGLNYHKLIGGELDGTLKRIRDTAIEKLPSLAKARRVELVKEPVAAFRFSPGGRERDTATA